MEFKVCIKCNICHCSFELLGSYIKEHQKLECPNCKQPFPQDLFEKLKVGMTNLYEVPEETVENHSLLAEETGFKLSVKEWSIFKEHGLK
ncbi:MAG: hypothetical protein GXW85_04760 [Clostridia bacterium]|nr:hypothetical protein [Clostridia bacterium]